MNKIGYIILRITALGAVIGALNCKKGEMSKDGAIVGGIVAFVLFAVLYKLATAHSAQLDY
jgi:hypothetical protein